MIVLLFLFCHLLYIFILPTIDQELLVVYNRRSITILTIYTLFSFSLKKNENYTIIRNIDSIEIRQYPSLIYASYYSKSENNTQFRTLANYIFGGNNKNEQIGMTSPVNMRLSSKNKDMMFLMPQRYKIENLPKICQNCSYPQKGQWSLPFFWEKNI